MTINPYFLTSLPLTYETTGVELASSPVINVTNDNMDMSYRSVGTTAYFVLGCSGPVDTIAVLHTNQRAADTYRVRAADTVEERWLGSSEQLGAIAKWSVRRFHAAARSGWLK